MYNQHERNRPSDPQNGEQIASAQNEDEENEKAVTSAHRKEASIPLWDPTENIVSGYEDFYKSRGSIDLRMERFQPHEFQYDQEVRAKAYREVFGPVDKAHLFSSLTQLQSNFVLVVEGKEVHVQTSFLSMHSQYFQDQFAKDKSVNRAILRNINYDEFIEVLGVIYGRDSVTADNVETIAKLAHIFKMTIILGHCEVFLMINNSNFGRVRLFLMAHWYDLEHLQAKCIAECKTANSLKQLRNEPEFAFLDCRMKAVFLDKIVEVNTAAASPTAKRNQASGQRNVSSARATNILNTLASSTSVPSDVVLVVENNRIRVHKAYLSIYSEYFKAMFMGEFQEKHQEEIALEEVDYAGMLELLAVIYPTDSPVTEENIEAVLELSDRFIMPSLMDRCKKALKCSCKLKTPLKLLLAQRCRFSDLQIALAQQFKSVEDVMKLRAESEYASFDNKTCALIFDNITSPNAD